MILEPSEKRGGGFDYIVSPESHAERGNANIDVMREAGDFQFSRIPER